MVHKVEVGGKSYDYNRPVIALERRVRKLSKEISEKLSGVDEDSVLAEIKVLWREAATLMLVSPDEDVLDYEKITDGESADICAGFFEAARKTSAKPPVG